MGGAPNTLVLVPRSALKSVYGLSFGVEVMIPNVHKDNDCRGRNLMGNPLENRNLRMSYYVWFGYSLFVN